MLSPEKETSDMNDTPLTKQTFEYRDENWVAEGYVSVPRDIQSPRPCVLVGHDWSGLNDHTKATTDALAALGYVGVAVDVYGKGRRGDTLGDNGALMNPLIEDRALLLRRLRASLRAAQALDSVDAARVAIVGYCFGGLCALDLARSSPDGLVGGISTHGLLMPPSWTVAAPIRPRLLVLHGWADPMAPPDHVVAGLDALSDQGAAWELHAYGHAMHAFTFAGANFPERGIAHHPVADRRSWQATVGFLAELFAR
jgi:dienelactone hydrolase